MNRRKKTITGLIVLLPFLTFGQTADFSFSTADGLYCSPQRVTFTQQCTGTPDGFIWRFGNGAEGIHPVESVTYFAPGTYSVTLIAVYADVAISVTKTVVINPTPMVTLTADRNQVCQPATIHFTAAGSAFITSYEWDFGDGTALVTTGTPTTDHFFNAYDSSRVTVRAISATGCYSTASTMIYITRFSILSGGINPPGGCIPVTTSFFVLPDPPAGDPAVQFTWDFGDGSPLLNTTVDNTTHIYNIVTPVTTASVIVTTASGCSSQYNYNPFAFGTPPTNPVAVTNDGLFTYCASETIRFNGAADNASHFLWDYGDGTRDSTTSPFVYHRYRSLGPKRMIMTPYFNGCRSATSDTVDITIIGVVANYDFHNLCTAKNHFIYDNLSLGNISSFSWTFSDIPGSPDILNYNTSHTFPARGSFSTLLHLSDAGTGCVDTMRSNQYTATPVFTSSTRRVCKDSLITYKVLNAYPPASGYLYLYYVNGATATLSLDSNLTLYPELHGVFNEFVIISGPTNNTCDDTLYLPAATTVSGPVLDFSIPFNSCFLNNSFPITNNTQPFFPADPIVTWDWDFGDNTSSNVRVPPPHSYSHPGTFWLFFQATDINGCAQRDSQLVRVNPTPEIYVLPRADTLCSGDSLFLMAFTIDDFQWTTNYNISCVTCDTTLVKPAYTTNYIAEATNIFGCSFADTARIKVYEPFILQVSPADTSICIGAKVQFNTNVKGAVNWSPPDFLSAVNIHNPVSTPDSSLTYRIIVIDSGACYADTTTAVIRVNYKPTVNAGNDQVVPFYNSFIVSPAYSPDVVSYRWTPAVNSLSCLSCPVVSGIATQTTQYTIEVANVHGCKAKDDMAVIVACNKANLNLPTAFTPDNDGINDQFYPLTRGYKLINKFVVYNRWGNKVFERSDFAPNIASLGWNGTSKDKQPIDSGVFIWTIEATCDMGQKVQSKGTVALIR